MPLLRLRLLGPFEVEDATGNAIPSMGRHGTALLAYLAVTNRPQPREVLASLFWADRPDEQARHSLRQTLLAVRRSLKDDAGTILLTQVETVSLNMSVIEVDVEVFDSLARNSDSHSADRALALYRGDLLEGFNIRAEEFESWLTAERGRLRDLAMMVLERRLIDLSRANDLDGAIEVATRLLSLEPARESAHRELMRIYDRSGQRSLALRQFKICSDAVKREFDAAPEPETLQVFAAIRDRSVPQQLGDHPVIAEQSDSEGLPPVPSITIAGEGGAPIGRVTGGRPWHSLGAILLLAVVAGGLVYAKHGEYTFRPGTENAGLVVPRPDQPSVAVLPFRSIGGDPNQESLAIGITEGIVSALSTISRIFVVSPGVPAAPSDMTKTSAEIAKFLGVRYVLEGGIQQASGRLRITSHLVDMKSGAYLWSNRYDRELGDIFSIQDEITLEVVTALQVKLGDGDQERILLAHGTRDLDAWILAGHAFQRLRRLTPEDTAWARQLYQQALDRDPRYAGARDGLAWTYLVEARFGWAESGAAALAKAGELAQQTLELDSTRARTYATLGTVSLLSGNYSEAVAHGEKAIALAPTDAEAAALLAYTLTFTGESGRSITLLIRAMNLSPYYPDWYRWTLGRAYRLAGRSEEALAVLADNSAAESSIVPKIERALAIYAMGRLQEARAEARKAMQTEPNLSIRKWEAVPRYKDAKLAAQEVAALRALGLPD